MDSEADATASDLGNRIALWREAWGLSQRELARRADITNGALSQIEKGNASPAVQTVEKLATAFGLDLQRFMFGLITPPYEIAAFGNVEQFQEHLQHLSEKFDYTPAVFSGAFENTPAIYTFEIAAGGSFTGLALPIPKVCAQDACVYIFVRAGALVVQGGSNRHLVAEGGVAKLLPLNSVSVSSAHGNPTSLLAITW